MVDNIQIQKEIKKAMQELNQKEVYSEAILAKKIRENAKIDGKKKAGIAMNDLEKVLAEFEEEGIFYELHLNSANDLLIKKGGATKFLEGDARRRRQSSEKSMTIFTNKDLRK